jgi:hypothetical protein
MKKNNTIAEYVEQMSELLDLQIAPEQCPSVINNFSTIAAIAKLVTEFPLPSEIEAATVFEP